jgi:hypothetical protein
MFALKILTAKCKSGQWIISYNSKRANLTAPRTGTGRRAKTTAIA